MMLAMSANSYKLVINDLRKTSIAITAVDKQQLGCEELKGVFTAKRPFDLPSESESGFTMNFNTDSIIKYSLMLQCTSDSPTRFNSSNNGR